MRQKHDLKRIFLLFDRKYWGHPIGIQPAKDEIQREPKEGKNGALGWCLPPSFFFTFFSSQNSHLPFLFLMASPLPKDLPLLSKIKISSFPYFYIREPPSLVLRVKLPSDQLFFHMGFACKSLPLSIFMTPIPCHCGSISMYKGP